MLPQNQLANALLILGFSHVCVLKGAALAPAEAVAAALELPPQLQSLAPALRSRSDGFSALVYALVHVGCGVVTAPQENLNGSDSAAAAAMGIVIDAPHDAATTDKIARHLAAVFCTKDGKGSPTPISTLPLANADVAVTSDDVEAVTSTSSASSSSTSKGFFGLGTIAFDTGTLLSRISNAFAASKPMPRSSDESMKRAVGVDNEL